MLATRVRDSQVDGETDRVFAGIKDHNSPRVLLARDSAERMAVKQRRKIKDLRLKVTASSTLVPMQMPRKP